ncbi:MAG: F0F1 ATP synthase subunit B [Gammaproteobacteria bacterium]|nr:F0F1 ATP synthase subunit B [Gammaproteobacteria bacterium]
MNITVTLLAQMVAFALLIVFVNRVLWGPLSAALADRQKRIAEGLAAAERGRHEHELAEKRAKTVLEDAKKQAAEILASAQKRGNELVEEAKTNAMKEADRVKAQAQAELQQEVQRAREQLRKDVSTVAIAAASKLLKKEVDSKAHAALLNDLAAQV